MTQKPTPRPVSKSATTGDAPAPICAQSRAHATGSRTRPDPWSEVARAVARRTDRDAAGLFDFAWSTAGIEHVCLSRDEQLPEEDGFLEWMASVCPEVRADDPCVHTVVESMGINLQSAPETWTESDFVGKEERALESVAIAVGDPQMEGIAVGLLVVLFRLMPLPAQRARLRLIMAGSSAQAGRMEATAAHVAVACKLSPSAEVARDAGAIVDRSALKHRAISAFAAMMRRDRDVQEPQWKSEAFK